MLRLSYHITHDVPYMSLSEIKEVEGGHYRILEVRTDNGDLAVFMTNDQAYDLLSALIHRLMSDTLDGVAQDKIRGMLGIG